MRIAFAALLIIIFVAAPGYLLPWLMRTDSGEELLGRASRQLISALPEIPDIRTISVAPFEEDFHQRLQFALADELRREGRFQVVENDLFRKRKISLREIVDDFRGPRTDIQEEANRPDAILCGKIQRNEKKGKSHKMQIQVLLVDPSSGTLLWSRDWGGSQRMPEGEWENRKTLMLICLAFAAGILVIFARREE